MKNDWRRVGGARKYGLTSVYTDSINIPEGTLYRSVSETGQISTLFVPKVQSSAVIGWQSPDALPLDEEETIQSPWEGAPPSRNA